MARPRAFDRSKAVQQAMDVFWQQGYEAASVQVLGAAMGLNPGSLYNAFTDKHTLFVEALRCYQDREYQVACDLFAGPVTGYAAIRRFFLFVVDHDSRDPSHKGCLMVNTAAELADRDPQVQGLVAASRAQMVALFRAAIVQAQQAGEIAAERDPETLAAFLVNSLFGLRLTAKILHDRPSLLAIVDATLAALST
ncbi:MAG: TetR/AcrR family transcriptional regulator [Roseiflexaceae bacterium]